MTRIAVLGAGHVGANLARLLAAAGHQVTISFARDKDRLARTARELGVTAARPAEAVASAEVTVLSVPWAAVDDALGAVGGPEALAGLMVLDTTNQFGLVEGRFGVLDLGVSSAAACNAAKAPAARWVKAFNTLTADFQATAAGRTGPDRVAMFYGCATEDLAPQAETLITDAGFVPVPTGTLARNDVGHQEPKGELYGEEFHRDNALALASRLRGTPPSGTGRP